MKKRCDWAEKNELERQYHDLEWGIPLHEDQKLFEYLILEGAQAGLSWSIILAKRDGYRQAFDNFDVNLIANYDESKMDELKNDTRIVRNKLKIKATVSNAQVFLKIQEEFGSFDDYIWKFVKGKTIINKWDTVDQVPASTLISDEMSKALKKRGFKFVGSTICYAFMQATGMVNDHLTSCFRFK